MLFQILILYEIVLACTLDEINAIKIKHDALFANMTENKICMFIGIMKRQGKSQKSYLEKVHSFYEAVLFYGRTNPKVYENKEIDKILFEMKNIKARNLKEDFSAMQIEIFTGLIIFSFHTWDSLNIITKFIEYLITHRADLADLWSNLEFLDLLLLDFPDNENIEYEYLYTIYSALFKGTQKNENLTLAKKFRLKALERLLTKKVSHRSKYILFRMSIVSFLEDIRNKEEPYDKKFLAKFNDLFRQFECDNNKHIYLGAAEIFNDLSRRCHEPCYLDFERFKERFEESLRTRKDVKSIFGVGKFLLNLKTEIKGNISSLREEFIKQLKNSIRDLSILSDGFTINDYFELVSDIQANFLSSICKEDSAIGSSYLSLFDHPGGFPDININYMDGLSVRITLNILDSNEYVKNSSIWFFEYENVKLFSTYLETCTKERIFYISEKLIKFATRYDRYEYSRPELILKYTYLLEELYKNSNPESQLIPILKKMLEHVQKDCIAGGKFIVEKDVDLKLQL